MSRPAATGQGKLLSLQYGRGIAALMVIFQHAYFQIDAFAPRLAWHSAPAAVDIFFMVSGVIMVVTTQRAGPVEFALRRLVRIVPLYWLFTLALAGLWLVVPGGLHSTVVTWRTLAQSLLFIPHYNLGHPAEIWPILVPGWTLNYEMFFYLVFGLLLVFPLRRRLLLAAALFVALVAAGSLSGIRNPVLRTDTDPLLLDFVVGMAIGYLYLQRRRFPVWAGWLLVSAGTWLIAADMLAPLAESGIRLPVFGTAAALLVLGGVQLDMADATPRSGLLLRLGDASYSIYLSHLITLGLLRVAWSRLGLAAAGAWSAHVFALAGLALAAAAGYAVYTLIERPLLEAGHRLLRARSRPVPAAPPLARALEAPG